MINNNDTNNHDDDGNSENDNKDDGNEHANIADGTNVRGVMMTMRIMCQAQQQQQQ